MFWLSSLVVPEVVALDLWAAVAEKALFKVSFVHWRKRILQ